MRKALINDHRFNATQVSYKALKLYFDSIINTLTEIAYDPDVDEEISLEEIGRVEKERALTLPIAQLFDPRIYSELDFSSSRQLYSVDGRIIHLVHNAVSEWVDGEMRGVLGRVTDCKFDGLLLKIISFWSNDYWSDAFIVPASDHQVYRETFVGNPVGFSVVSNNNTIFCRSLLLVHKCILVNRLYSHEIHALYVLEGNLMSFQWEHEKLKWSDNQIKVTDIDLIDQYSLFGEKT